MVISQNASSVFPHKKYEIQFLYERLYKKEFYKMAFSFFGFLWNECNLKPYIHSNVIKASSSLINLFYSQDK